MKSKNLVSMYLLVLCPTVCLQDTDLHMLLAKAMILTFRLSGSFTSLPCVLYAQRFQFETYSGAQVTNPLSVKTKVHVPRSPTALLSSAEREKVFLEVHIQNLTPDAMWLQRMRFEPIEGWHVQDTSMSLSGETIDDGTIFPASMALMQPQDTRQYVYILSPKELSLFPLTHAPGAIVPLGRLDISWRSAFGEPGRLLTSVSLLLLLSSSYSCVIQMLSRRIPLIQGAGPAQPPAPPPKQPVSALPLHLQRSNTVSSGTGTPPRVQSPQLTQRPMSPPVVAGTPAPYRPASPFRTRTGASMSLSTLPQSPVVAAPPPSNPAIRRPDETVDVQLTIRDIPREKLFVEKPFRIAFTATVSAPVIPSGPGQPRKQRVLSLIVQHVQPSRGAAAPPSSSAVGASTADTWSPRMTPFGFSTPSPYGTPHRGDFPDTLAQKLMYASPRHATSDLTSDAGTENGGGDITPAPPTREERFTTILPPPFAATDAADRVNSEDVRFLGPSAVFLPQLRLLSAQIGAADDMDHPSAGHERNLSESTVDSDADSELHEPLRSRIPRALASQDFELEFILGKAGYATVGGLRILVVEDRTVEGEDQVSSNDRPIWLPEARTLKEWDVIAEVWVNTALETAGTQ
jgi:trafficking protein particle complex subunit 13